MNTKLNNFIPLSNFNSSEWWKTQRLFFFRRVYKQQDNQNARFDFRIRCPIEDLTTDITFWKNLRQMYVSAWLILILRLKSPVLSKTAWATRCSNVWLHSKPGRLLETQDTFCYLPCELRSLLVRKVELAQMNPHEICLGVFHFFAGRLHCLRISATRNCSSATCHEPAHPFTTTSMQSFRYFRWYTLGPARILLRAKSSRRYMIKQSLHIQNKRHVCFIWMFNGEMIRYISPANPLRSLDLIHRLSVWHSAAVEFTKCLSRHGVPLFGWVKNMCIHSSWPTWLASMSAESSTNFLRFVVLPWKSMYQMVDTHRR